MISFVHKPYTQTVILFLMALLVSPSLAAAKPFTDQQTFGKLATDSTLIRVATSGTNDDNCGGEQLPCKTLQFAINKALNGDTLRVAGGTYSYDAASDICTPNLGSTAVACIINKQVTILGGYSTSNWEQPSPTTNPTLIDGAGTVRGVWAVSTGPQTSLSLQSFTIQHGLATGISARPDIRDKTTGFGGGMFIEDAAVILKDVIFWANKALGSDTNTEFGGSAGGGGLTIKGTSGNAECKNHISQLEMENVNFVENQAIAGAGATRGGYAVGGGFFSSNATVQGSVLRFEKNQALAGSTQGGGKSPNGEFADAQGGGLAAQGCSDVTISNIIVQNNFGKGGGAPNGNAGGAYGGGLYAEKASLIVSDALVTNNLAEGGDGINSEAKATASALAEGGGILSFISNVVIDRVTVVNNTARGGSGQSIRGSAGGGGVAVIDIDAQHTATLRNSIIADNSVEMGGGTDNNAGGGGGGLWVQGIKATAAHLTIVHNRLNQPSLQGDAVVLLSFSAAATLDLNYSIIADHPGTGNSTTLYTQSNSVINLTSGLLANNQGDPTNNGQGGAGIVSGLDSMITTASAGFIPGSWEYRISAISAAHNAANGSSETLDRDAKARDAQPDIGAFEAPPFTVQLIPTFKNGLTVYWGKNAGVAQYRVAVTCPAGGNPPAGQVCGRPFTVDGALPSTDLADLSPDRVYAVTVETLNAAGQILTSAAPVSSYVYTDFSYLPTVQR